MVVPNVKEAARIAVNIARNLNAAVFPCGATKMPTRPKSEGGNGYKDASSDPDCIAWLWRHWPGELIGLATGAVSGWSVLDVDQKHAPARAWWRANRSSLLPTRTYESRSGGLHLYFQHVVGVTCTTGRICTGVDIRGDGGYAIAWFAAGLGCHDHSPAASWPPWLLAELTRPAPQQRIMHAEVPVERALDGLARRVATAQQGERNAMLFWAACRCAQRRMHQDEAEALLIPAAIEAGLPEIETRRTITSAIRSAAS